MQSAIALRKAVQLALVVGTALLSLPAFARQAPYDQQIPLSGRDRVYTADQTSNTVSVIDPASNRLLGVIPLGDPLPATLSPLYNGQLLVHGLGYSPDHHTLDVISIGSNSVTLIDTATNRVKGTVYVGRSPHEGLFTPNGKELWVAVRGEDYVSVIDPVKMQEVRRIKTANGPSMVLFRPDGRYAYVPSSFTPELTVIDVRTHRVVGRVKQVSPFAPDLAVSPDGKEVWFTLKDTGRTQIISASPPFNTLAVLDTGPITNHVNFADNRNGQFAYVTVGGLNAIKVYRRGGRRPQLVATIAATGDLPHGIWPSGDGARMYVGLENGDGVQVIDTLSNRTIATVPVGQLPQALVYIPDAVPSGAGTAGLKPLDKAVQALHVRLVPLSRSGRAQATAVINPQGAVDQIQVAATGLKPGQEYQLVLVDSSHPPYGQKTPLARVKANPAGGAIGGAISPLRSVVGPASAQGARRYLAIIPIGNDEPVLIQAP